MDEGIVRALAYFLVAFCIACSSDSVLPVEAPLLQSSGCYSYSGGRCSHCHSNTGSQYCYVDVCDNDGDGNYDPDTVISGCVRLR